MMPVLWIDDADPQPINAIPFREAALCCNCEMVIGRLDRCSLCGSGSLLVLSKVLDGERIHEAR